MSGVLQAIMGADVGGPGFNPSSVAMTIGAGDALTLNTNGTSAGTNEGIPSWYTPTTTSIGNSFWCKFTTNSGTNPNTGTVGSVLALSSSRAWTWNSGNGGGSYTINLYSDSGGTILVGTLNISVSP